MWNPNQNTDADNLKFCWLRAAEWDAWPFFLSQPVVPFFLAMQIIWWKILLVLSGIQFIWTMSVRLDWMSVRYAEAGMFFVILRWVVCPSSAFFLYRSGQWQLALLALLWPLAMLVLKTPVWMVMGILSVPLGFKVSQLGVIQRRFMEQLGYTSNDETYERPRA